MFEFVNEVAVLGTTFFMVAVAMVWYSEYLFQKQWMRAVGFTPADMEASAPHMKRDFVLTFISYAISIFFIAVLIGNAQVLDISVQHLSLGLALGFASLIAGFVIWEQRSLTYYLITAGFSSVFILGSSFILYNWPW